MDMGTIVSTRKEAPEDFVHPGDGASLTVAKAKLRLSKLMPSSKDGGDARVNSRRTSKPAGRDGVHAGCHRGGRGEKVTKVEKAEGVEEADHYWMDEMNVTRKQLYIACMSFNSSVHGDHRAEQTAPDQTVPDQTEPDQTEPDQTVPDQTEPDQTEPDQIELDQTVPDQTVPDQTEPDQTEPDPTAPDQTAQLPSDPFLEVAASQENGSSDVLPVHQSTDVLPVHQSTDARLPVHQSTDPLPSGPLNMEASHIEPIGMSTHTDAAESPGVKGRQENEVLSTARNSYIEGAELLDIKGRQQEGDTLSTAGESDLERAESQVIRWKQERSAEGSGLEGDSGTLAGVTDKTQSSLTPVHDEGSSNTVPMTMGSCPSMYLPIKGSSLTQLPHQEMSGEELADPGAPGATSKDEREETEAEKEGEGDGSDRLPMDDSHAPGTAPPMPGYSDELRDPAEIYGEHSILVAPPDALILHKAAEFRGGMVRRLKHLTTSLKMEYHDFMADVELTTFYAHQQVEAQRNYDPQTVLLISSRVPKATALQAAVRPNVFSRIYDFDEESLDSLLDIVKNLLDSYKTEARAKHLGIVCKGGPGYMYLLRMLPVTPVRLKKNRELSQFWRRLGAMMSKLNPGKSVIHLMESNVAGNKQGEMLIDDLEAVLFSHQVKVQSPLELAPSGRQMLNLYFDLEQHRAWKASRYTKFRLYK